MSHADIQQDQSPEEDGAADGVEGGTGARKVDKQEEDDEQAEISGTARHSPTPFKEVSKQIDLRECEELTPLGVYSIHEHQTSRAITLPQGADGFDEVTTVRQYCYDDGDRKFLIVAPLNI